MTLIRTEALILRNIPFQETSSIVRMFTKVSGKISIIAKGARQIKSPFRGYLEPLNYVDVIYYHKSTREIQVLSKVETIKSFFWRSPEIFSLAYATAVLECLDRLFRDQHKDEAVFYMVVETLEFMDAHRDRSREAFLCFLIGMAELLGYQLRLDECARCGHSLDTAVYDYESGRFFCKNCLKRLDDTIFMDTEMMAFIKSMKIDGLNENLQIIRNPDRANDLQKILLSYLTYHLEIPFHLKSLEIIKPDSPIKL